MLVPDRRRRVLEHVRRHGSAQVQQLAQDLGVSAWTVRRDLDELEAQGHLQRTHGGAFIDDGPSARPTIATDGGGIGVGDDRGAGDSGDNTAAKARIGALAARHLADDCTVMILAGSTTATLLPHLAHRRLTVVTNGLDIAYGLRHAADVSLMMLGGYLHREQMTLLGPMTEQSMADMHVDLIVAGAYGVHADIGVTGAKIIQAGYHHGMLRRTDALMVLADATKLGRRGPTVLASMDDIDTLITDVGASADVVEQLRDRGPDVLLA